MTSPSGRAAATPPSRGLSPKPAFALLYAAQFGFLGVQLPFVSRWLEGEGFTTEAIGLLGGAALIIRLLLAPPLAYRAETARDPRTPLKLVALALAGASAGLLFALPQAAVAVLFVVLFLAFGLGVPLADANVLRADKAGQLDFSRIRSVGSLAFIAANLIGGLVIEATTDEAIVVWMAVSAGLLVWASWILPPAPPRADAAPPSLAVAGELFRSRSFLLLIFSAGLCQASHAVYYTFSVLQFDALGYPSWLVGCLWTVGVTVEIGMLFYGRRILARINPATLIALAGLTALVRWPLTGLNPPLPVLFALQLGHAGTFTAAYLGTVEFVGRAVPEVYRGTAMTIISTVGIGALTGAATAGAGQVFEAEAPFAAYAVMGAMGAGGTALALMLRRRWDGGTLRALDA